MVFKRYLLRRYAFRWGGNSFCVIAISAEVCCWHTHCDANLVSLQYNAWTPVIVEWFSPNHLFSFKSLLEQLIASEKRL
jgi:hypothetical protein